MPEGFTKLRGFMGCNFTDPPHLIADNELRLARNCFGKDVGVIGPRQQQQLYGSAFTANFLTIRDDALDACLFHFLDAQNRPHILMWQPYIGSGVVNGQFWLFDESLNGGTAATVARPDSAIGALVSSIQRPLGTPSKPTSLLYNNQLFVFLGHTFPGLILGADDLNVANPSGTPLPRFRQLGSTWAAFGTNSDAIADQLPFAFGEIYKGVFALGGLPAPYESLVFFTQGIDSAGLPAPAFNSLLTSAKSAAAGFGDGDKLLRVQTIPVTGGALAVEQYALMMKQRSIWLMQGDPPTTTDTGTLVVTPLMRREGLISPHAVCKTTDSIVWCSGRNVWMMSPGTQPREIGYKIKGFLATLPQTPTSAWFMEFHDDTLYLNVPSPKGLADGRRVSDGAATQYPQTQQLWCDLRDPEKPQWWGPEDVRATHMLSLVQSEGVHQLIGVAARGSKVIASLDSTEWVPFLMAERGDSKSRDLGDSGVTGGYSGTQVPNSTFQDVRFREMDFGDDNLMKIVDGLEVNATWDIGLGTAKGTTLASDTPMDARFIGDAGKQTQTPTMPGRGAVTIGVNPASGVLLLNEDDSGAGPFAADIAALALRTKYARQLQVQVSAGWGGGAVTLTGTDMYGNALVEVVSTAAVAAAGGIVNSVGYFLTWTNMSFASTGAGAQVNINEGPATSIQDMPTDPAGTGFTLGQNTLGASSVNPGNLAQSFVPLVFFPASSSRFNCFTFQPRLLGKQVNDVASPATADDVRTRRFWVKSLTPRVRPVGRRPGGSFGS